MSLPQCEDCSQTPFAVFKDNIAAMGTCDRPCNGQAKPTAPGRAVTRHLTPGKWLEQAGQLLVPQARPFIIDLDRGKLSITTHLYQSARSILQRIVQQIA